MEVAVIVGEPVGQLGVAEGVGEGVPPLPGSTMGTPDVCGVGVASGVQTSARRHWESGW